MEPHWPSLSAAKTHRDSWTERFLVERTEDLCRFVESVRGFGRCTAISRCRSGHNVILRLRWQASDASDWAIRIPIPENSVFMREKLRNEVAMLNYLDTHTTVPIPRVYKVGTAADNPTGLGPFIITNWIKGRSLVKVLRERNLLAPDGFVLVPEGERIMKRVYGQIAGFLLQLWTKEFEKIGAVGVYEGVGARAGALGGYEVRYPPLTLYMNELVRRYGLKKTALPQQTYSRSHEYFKALLGMQWSHVVLQKNSVRNSTDAREKFTVRGAMALVASSFISRDVDNEAPFRLFSDDFSLSNVLVDENFEITGITDWGFTYAAPSQFAYSCPWWLTALPPDTIIQRFGMSRFREVYTRQFAIFVDQLKLREIESGMQGPGSLSSKMVNSFLNRGAWFVLACRMGAILDDVYWSILDNFCWGRVVSRDERVMWLAAVAADRDYYIRDREVFVERKIRDLIEYCRLMGIPCTERYAPPPSVVRLPRVMMDKMTQTPSMVASEGGDNINTNDDYDGDDDIEEEDSDDDDDDDDDV
ncbi:phosphotransferase enzyme family protein [Blastomyces gilchristii SLH14081]|uniref:Phosphotransferase enzyme family protein n=2 Tax=Blastomyces TaxID=229219 RepID=A0A179UKM6_BLAGS|nr:phosphotransferase enzyme family protein [Blastomyces gilchristii SLH14081]EGE80473.2 phosphotransferase enzyme family protein [Blastomyces dermatitidis ATCC 18188]OAT08605.1 phosphotransferase enzyme family protein [Blastomyces gilchristii SLH14081]